MIGQKLETPTISIAIQEPSVAVFEWLDVAEPLVRTISSIKA